MHRLWIIAAQAPFLLYLVLVPLERRAVPHRLGAAFLAGIAVAVTLFGAVL